MPQRYLSPVLHELPDVGSYSVSMTGTEAKIYNSILNLMLQSKLRPGAKIKEEALTDHFGVSRTVIRKVMVVLEQEGLVSLPLNRGAYVAVPTLQDGLEVCKSLRLIAGNAAEELSLQPADQRKKVTAKLVKQKLFFVQAESDSDLVNVRRISGEFFILMVHLNGNKILSLIFEVLITRMSLVLTSFQGGMLMPSGQEFQEKLIKFIEDGKSLEAKMLTLDLFEGILDKLVANDDSSDLDLRSLLVSIDRGNSKS